MSDARAALEQLIAALERHYEAANTSRDPDHPTVVAAAQDLAEAFDDYDEALFDATEVATPLALYGEGLDDDDDSDDDGVYAGLDADDYDDSDDGDADDDEYDFDDDDDDDDVDAGENEDENAADEEE